VAPSPHSPSRVRSFTARSASSEERSRCEYHMSIVAQLKRVAGADDDATPLATHGILRDAPFVIGRQHGVDVRFVEAAVSRRHAVFQVVDGKMVLKNMSKLNPVSLNDTILDVETAVTLRHGDVVGIQLSSEEEATFIFEQLADSIARSPLRENGGNTPMSVSPIKGSSNASMKSPASPGGSDENEAPPTQRRSTPRRSMNLGKLTGTPMPSRDILKQVSALKMSETKGDASTKKSPAKASTPKPIDTTLMGRDFDDELCGTPEENVAMTPKSPAKSALKAPENRLAVRPSTIRRRSISFAGAEELEAIKWIAPHNGRVELCGRIAPLALNAPRSPRQRRTPSKSPESATKRLPAPEVLLALPAPESNQSPAKKRRSSISFKAVEDGEENETPEASFTRSGSQMQRNDTPRQKYTASPGMEFTPMGTIGGSDFDEDVDQTASVAAITPLDQSSNLMDRMDFVATPSSEFKRPPAPHNTPVANVAQSPGVEFNLDGFNLFRNTPGSMPQALRGFFEQDDARCDAIIRAVEALEAAAEEDVNVAGELDGALALLPTPPSTTKRVDEWLRTDLMLADVPDDDEDDNGGEVLSITSRAMPSPAKSVIVKCKKRKRREGKSTANGLSMRMQQLHRALALSRRALLKERKRSAALKEMYLELMNTREDVCVQHNPEEAKTPKVAMQINVKEATPQPQKTPRVAMQINVKEATPKTPKVVLNININEPTPQKTAQKVELCKPTMEEEKKSATACCSVCSVVDKCKTLTCDACAVMFHLKCLKPKLTRTPKGPWTCASCPELAKDTATDAPKRKAADTTEAPPTRSSRRTRRS